ncbi:hypothetical protein LSUE1_G003394, partial [Lachnellula suecica]
NTSNMPAPSLFESSQRACIKNIRSLTDVGDFEYWKIRTVLQRIDSPEQLHQIELHSPQIRSEDAELWRAFIVRDIPNWASKNYAPKNPLKWYEVYCKYKKEQRRDIERDEEILRNTMLGIKKHKETMVSKVVDLRTLPKVPKDPRMLANNGGVPLGKRSGVAKLPPNSLTWNGGSKTKMKDGKSVLVRARREAREIGMRSKLATPTSMLVGNKKQIVKAPAGMVNEYRRAADPGLKILSRKKRPTIGQFDGGISGPSLEEREERLRAAMSGGPKGYTGAVTGTETMIGSSDEESMEDDEEEVDDLFDDEPPRPSSAPRNPQYPTSRPPPRPVSSSSAARPPPNDMNRPRPGLSSAPQSQMSSTPPSRPNSASPAPGARPMMPRKRPPVDVFNRGAKKPRVAR